MPQFCHQYLSPAQQTINAGYLQILALEHLLIISSFCFSLFFQVVLRESVYESVSKFVRGFTSVNITSIERNTIPEISAPLFHKVPARSFLD